MPETPEKPPRSESAALTAAVMASIHGIVWSAYFFFLGIIVPVHEKIFREFDMKLPWLTVWVLDISNWVVSYFYLLPFHVAVLLAVDGAVLYFLRRGSKAKILSWLWFVLIMALSIAVFALSVLAMQLPRLKLLEGLNK